MTSHSTPRSLDLESTEGHITHAICAAKSGLFAVKARVFVDGTGDGDIAAWAGAPFEKGDAEWQYDARYAMQFMGGCGLVASQSSQGSALEQAFADNVFTVKDRHLPGIWRVGNHVGGGNIGHTFGVDGTDERSLTDALLWGRKSMLEYKHYYTNYLQGFEKMQLVATGALMGLRETRRIIGDYVLCLEDFKNRAVFEDEIGRYAYPVDIHASAPDEESFKQFEEEFKTLRYKDGESYGIPYRILTPRGLDNTLVAGRCISADRFLQGSIRVMPGCYITGQAAGIAAAIAVEQEISVHDIDVNELQRPAN